MDDLEEKVIQLLSHILIPILAEENVPKFILFDRNDVIFSVGNWDNLLFHTIMMQWDNHQLQRDLVVNGTKHLQIHVSDSNLIYKNTIQNQCLIGGKIPTLNYKLYFFSEMKFSALIQLILTSLRELIESILSFASKIKDVIIVQSQRTAFRTNSSLEDQLFFNLTNFWDLGIEKVPVSIQIYNETYGIHPITESAFIFMSLESQIIGIRLQSHLDAVFIFGILFHREEIALIRLQMERLLSFISKTPKIQRQMTPSSAINSEIERSKLVLTSEESISNSGIPFTALLMAYYRAQEQFQAHPLISDPFAMTLAGDVSHFVEKHIRYAQMDYSIVRAYFIEQTQLIPWILKQKTAQIVILGAGLDTRAYRLKELRSDLFTIYEVDLPLVIQYKEKLLRGEQPLCKMIRVPADLSDPSWINELKKRGFLAEIPTYWILEGLLYYLQKETAAHLLQQISEVSEQHSALFADICIPIISQLKMGPFTQYFQWGLEIDDVASFFENNGWQIQAEFADKYDFGRDVGQKSQIFIVGRKY